VHDHPQDQHIVRSRGVQARLWGMGHRRPARAVCGRGRADPDRPRQPAERPARSARQGAVQGHVRALRRRRGQGDGGERVCGRPTRAATVTCEFPGGRKVVANGIFELEDARIVRELQVLSGDPK